jgi:hypothetical protein
MSRDVIDTVQVPLPAYSDAYLDVFDADALIDLLVADEDRVPRNAIDVASRLGEPMISALRERLRGAWDLPVSRGEWWLRLHAAMILGLMERESAGSLLVEFMRRMAEADDDALQDWLAGEWPAFFANKPPSVLDAVRDLCLDRRSDWYVRANALEVVVAVAARQDPDTLESTLAWIADNAADERERPEMRPWWCHALLDYPREQYRPLLESLAASEPVPGAAFDAEDIRRAYAGDPEHGPSHLGKDPWRFYTPESIRERQDRWAREVDEDDGEADESDDALATIVEPYVRELPKVGRNDPCPCGSGRKFKKCCLPTWQAQFERP